MANETRTPRTPGPMGGLRGKGSKKKTGKQNPSQNPSQSFKKKEPEVMMLKMIEEGPANKHKSMKMQKMKKTTNSDGNIEFVELKAKGGRMGYKGGKSVKKKGGCAIKGKSPILR